MTTVDIYKNGNIVELIGNFYKQECISVYSSIDNCLDESTCPAFIMHNNIFYNNIINNTPHKILDKLWDKGIL